MPFYLNKATFSALVALKEKCLVFTRGPYFVFESFCLELPSSVMHRWVQNVWQECCVMKVSQVSSDLVDHSDLVFLTWGSMDFSPAWVEAATRTYRIYGEELLLPQ